MFVSIHIPKTAGTTLAKVFDDTSNRRVLYDYGSEMSLEDVRTCRDDFREHREFIKGYFEYLHGHFHYLKYHDVFGDCPVITTVRNPTDRVASQYRHVALHGDPNVKQHQMVMDGEIDIVRFSMFQYIGSAQWYFLEGREVKDYDYIFIQENMTPSVAHFAEKFKLPAITEYISWFDNLPKINKREGAKWDTKAIPVTKSQLKEVTKNCVRDYEIYNKALEIYKR